MSNSKIEAPAPPTDWELPEASPDKGAPDKSFHDDEVAARLKAREAAQSKAVQDRFVNEPPRRIVELHEKVEETAAFRPAHHDDAETQRAKRKGGAASSAGEETDASPGVKIRQSAHRGSPGMVGQTPEDSGKLEGRLHKLMDHLHDLDAQAMQTAANVNLPPNDLAARTQALTLQQQRMEMQARFVLSQLLTSGQGFPLLSDWRFTFKKLFDRLKRWPRRVRPGHRPETDEDMNAFLAWIFEPPDLPEDLNEGTPQPPV